MAGHAGGSKGRHACTSAVPAPTACQNALIMRPTKKVLAPYLVAWALGLVPGCADEVAVRPGPDAAQSVAVSAPTLAEPCGTDLDVNNGATAPDLGSLPPSTPWKGDDPARPGPLTVMETPTTIPIAGATLRAAGQEIPVLAGSVRATIHAPTAGAALPLVLVLPGFTISHTDYATYARHLASHGFAVIGVDTRAELFRAVHDREAHELTQVLTWATSDASPLAGRIDATKIALAGHSKGGKLAAYTAALDARVDLTIGWDPVNGGGGPCAFDTNCNRLPVAPNCQGKSAGIQSFTRAETLVLGAPPDALFNPDENVNAKHFYRGAPSPASYVLLDASHAAWSSITANAEVVRITKSVTTALLLSRFRAVTGLDPYLPGGTRLAAEPLVRETRRK